MKRVWYTSVVYAIATTSSLESKIHLRMRWYACKCTQVTRAVPEDGQLVSSVRVQWTTARWIIIVNRTKTVLWCHLKIKPHQPFDWILLRTCFCIRVFLIPPKRKRQIRLVRDLLQAFTLLAVALLGCIAVGFSICEFLKAEGSKAYWLSVSRCVLMLLTKLWVFVLFVFFLSLVDN